jgi:hypothetical protein
VPPQVELPQRNHGPGAPGVLPMTGEVLKVTVRHCPTRTCLEMPSTISELLPAGQVAGASGMTIRSPIRTPRTVCTSVGVSWALRRLIVSDGQRIRKSA